MKKLLIIISALLFTAIDDAAAQTVPVFNNGHYSFTSKNFYFEIAPGSGGRISSFKHKNQELLYIDTADKNNNWGSTFWPAPQSVWGWPPYDTLDSSPYSASVNGDVLTLKSMNKKASLYCRFEKIFKVNEADESVSVTYKIVNTGKFADTLGPWQITRVPSGGISFFPSGTTPARGMLLPLLKKENNISWFDYDSAFVSGDPSAVPKLFSDGSEGWLAHVTNNRKLMVFQFEDTPSDQKAPEEDEIEIYTNPNLAYTELEPLGPYRVIPAGKAHSWTVKWYARQVPDQINTNTGSKELIKYVRTITGTGKGQAGK